MPDHTHVVKARNNLAGAINRLRGGESSHMDDCDIALAELDIVLGHLFIACAALEQFTQHKQGCNAIRCMYCGCSVGPGGNQHLAWIGGEKTLEHDAMLGTCTCGLSDARNFMTEVPQDLL